MKKLVLLSVLLFGCHSHQCPPTEYKYVSSGYGQSERLEATLLSPLLQEFDRDLTNVDNKYRLHRAIAIIVTMRQENVFREDDLNFFMYELRMQINKESNEKEKQKLQEIYDRISKYQKMRREERQNARKKDME